MPSARLTPYRLCQYSSHRRAPPLAPAPVSNRRPSPWGGGACRQRASGGSLSSCRSARQRRPPRGAGAPAPAAARPAARGRPGGRRAALAVSLAACGGDAPYDRRVRAGVAPVLLSVLAPGLLYVAVADLVHAVDVSSPWLRPLWPWRCAPPRISRRRPPLRYLTGRGRSWRGPSRGWGFCKGLGRDPPEYPCGVAAAPFPGAVAGVSVAASRPATVAAPAFPAPPAASGGPSLGPARGRPLRAQSGCAPWPRQLSLPPAYPASPGPRPPRRALPAS